MWRKAAIARGKWVFPMLLAGLLAGACERTPVLVSGPLPQRVYVWQRTWTPAVVEALGEARRRTSGAVLLGGEVRWSNGRPSMVRASIDWPAVHAAGLPCALALRIAPYQGAFAEDDATARYLGQQAVAMLDAARLAGVEVPEFQLDFDCAQKRLPEYRLWLRALRGAVGPRRFVITTLPAWLGQREFAGLLQEVDGFVLQVHSVSLREKGGSTALCDPALARQWVSEAARLGRPFAVALPTYRCVAGYAPDGHFLDVAMDALEPRWPPGTRMLELASDADTLAALVREWTAAHPPAMKEVIWYRAPVATDQRNWRWATWSAVAAGRAPAHRLVARASGDNPTDLTIANEGEAEEKLPCAVTARWGAERLIASDALAGWSVQASAGRAVFTTTPAHPLRLPPGEQRPIGWLRHETPPFLQLAVEALPPAR